MSHKPEYLQTLATWNSLLPTNRNTKKVLLNAALAYDSVILVLLCPSSRRVLVWTVLSSASAHALYLKDSCCASEIRQCCWTGNLTLPHRTSWSPLNSPCVFLLLHCTLCAITNCTHFLYNLSRLLGPKQIDFIYKET